MTGANRNSSDQERERGCQPRTSRLRTWRRCRRSPPGSAWSSSGERTKEAPAAMVVTSFNVRGLNDEPKLRHLINSLYKVCGGKNTDSVACLQETSIEKEGKIPYLWRGNYYQTPGAGNSWGCVTLLSPHISIIEGKNIGNRAHLLACQTTGDSGLCFW